MQWQVLDRVAARGHGVFEDAVGACGTLAWVVDGASPVSDEVLSGAASDARWIASVADRHLRAAGERRDARPLTTIVAEIAESVRRALTGWAARPAVPPSAAVGIVRLRGDVIDYLVLTDVSIAMQGNPGWAWTDDAVVRTNERSVVEFRRALERSGSFREAYRVVRPCLREHRAECMNRPRGYWVLADDPRAARHAITGSIPAADAGRILLCTDGFARIVDCFRHYRSWHEFLESGTTLDSALRRLREDEAADAETLGHPRWSVSDDATAQIVAVG